MEINIKVGKQSFAAELFDNPTAHSFKALLPFTIELKDLNQNEKYAEIPGDLKVRPFNPRKIEAGDLMLYESNTLVLFYKSFSTPYSYTSLGLFTF
jgi:hypothetical protein